MGKARVNLKDMETVQGIEIVQSKIKKISNYSYLFGGEGVEIW